MQYFVLFAPSAPSAADEMTDEEELDDDDFGLELDGATDGKNLKIRAVSLRPEAIFKSALGLSRKKIEQAFYENRIRVNELKVDKKGLTLRINDEIDLIKSVSLQNENFLNIARVILHDVEPDEDERGDVSYILKITRFKQLLIENYSKHPYKGS
ncbi:unnamed protein product [Cyprideis torosa]|uniref:Mitochondrial transcription rescue factor 1 C-terminal domain-containing protein n=1 Tax=Cyprideis torosa TaxID=163714 RepID=A0A7R8W4R7_9CRUS|nr:unnamed protein product [Cyprideis torosa]CAG0884499.1 unnamed protein product [Cyprideis torosa]